MRRPKGVPYRSFDGDARAWRRLKRKEWRAVVKALRAFSTGSYFIPTMALKPFGEIQRLAGQITRNLSPERWGR